MSFSIGEEVLFDDERFVVATISSEEPKRYRLLASTAKGVKFEWVREKDLRKMTRYTKPFDDTSNY